MSVMYNPLSQMYQLTLKGAMSHQVELGSDPRGNITRIDNALAGIPRRMQNVENKLNDLNQQMAIPAGGRAAIQERTFGGAGRKAESGSSCRTG